MTTYHTDTMKSQFRHAIADKKHGENCLSFIIQANDFAWFDNATMKEQMKLWRKQIRGNIMKFDEVNNLNLTDNDGNDWFIIVAQPVDDKHLHMNPFGVMIFGVLIGGYVYAFKTKENRDAVFKYLMNS